jgi:prevent-host-death family protein
VKVAKLSDVKNELSRYVELVRRGGRVRILVSGVPAADIVPIDEASSDWTPDLVALERSGTIRRGKAGVARELLKAGPRVEERRMKQIFEEEREDRPGPR